jgi:hypothetical protein
MPFTHTKLFKFVIAPVMFVCCFVVLHDSYRATARMLLLALVVSYVCFLWTGKTRLMRLIFVAFLIAAWLPIDVSLTNYPGPPRLVPLIMGTPTDEDAAAEARGEVYLGGCILRDNPPRWMLVW